jgi:hypothetical protein
MSGIKSLLLAAAQFANGVIAKGGPKAGFGDPVFNTPDNCDHYYGAPGQLP